jgi:PAS domain S-box-containing protein
MPAVRQAIEGVSPLFPAMSGRSDSCAAEGAAARTAGRRPFYLVTTSAEECRALLDDLDAIIWEADPRTIQFSFVSQKAERLLGYPVDRWLHDKDFWVSLIHPDDRKWVVATSAAAVRDVRDHTFDYRVVAADGRTVWIRDVVHVTGDALGQASRLTGVMLDITA